VLAEPAKASSNGVAVEGTSTSEFLTDPFVVSLGTYIVGSNLKSTFNGNATGSNIPVDFGHTFDMNKDATRFRLDTLWRINEKHHVRLVYFNNDVSRTKTLDKDFSWGKYTFLANGSVNADSKLAVYELAYEYAFMRRPNFELAAGGGIHMLSMSFKLAGQATITDSNGNVSAGSFANSGNNLPVPLPVLGGRAAWAVTPSIIIEPEVQWFKFKYDAYDGSWWDLRAAAKWMFSRHFGVGLGYDYFHVKVDVTKSSFNGNVTLGYSGLQAMIVGSY
jgi:hypothetical protein